MDTKIQVTLTDRHVAALCQAYNWQKTLPDGTPNPQSETDCSMQAVVDFLNSIADGIDATNAAELAKKQAQAIIDSQPSATAQVV